MEFSQYFRKESLPKKEKGYGGKVFYHFL